MHRGYIPLFRKIQDHPFYREKRTFSKYEAWLDLLMEARHDKQPKEVIIGMKSVMCGYGQSIKSLRTWGARWGWSAQRVTRFFELLKKMNQIRYENVTVSTRVTIVNYEKYNTPRDRNETVSRQYRDSIETVSRQLCTTNNHYNHYNHDNHYNYMRAESHAEPGIEDAFGGGKKETKKKKRKKQFKEPSIEEVKEYCEERGNNIDPGNFIDFYRAKGWLVGKNKMVDWKAAIRTWERNETKKGDNVFGNAWKGKVKMNGFTEEYYRDGTSSANEDKNPYF